MTLTKVLWTSLTGAITIILALVGAWAHDNTVRITSLEARANTTEQHFVAIQKDYQDLRERLQELKEMVKEQQKFLPVVITPSQKGR